MLENLWAVKSISCGCICHVLISVLKKEHAQLVYVMNQNNIHNAGQDFFFQRIIKKLLRFLLAGKG